MPGCRNQWALLIHRRKHSLFFLPSWYLFSVTSGLLQQIFCEWSQYLQCTKAFSLSSQRWNYVLLSTSDRNFNNRAIFSDVILSARGSICSVSNDWLPPVWSWSRARYSFLMQPNQCETACDCSCNCWSYSRMDLQDKQPRGCSTGHKADKAFTKLHYSRAILWSLALFSVSVDINRYSKGNFYITKMFKRSTW